MLLRLWLDNVLIWLLLKSLKRKQQMHKTHTQRHTCANESTQHPDRKQQIIIVCFHLIIGGQTNMIQAQEISHISSLLVLVFKSAGNTSQVTDNLVN